MTRRNWSRTTYARRAAAREWLRSRDWNPDEVFPNPDSLPKSLWQAIDPKAVEICVREWYATMLEKHDLVLPEHVKVDPTAAELDERLVRLSTEITVHTHVPLPTLGKSACSMARRAGRSTSR
jgi:hypothetical protein